MMMKITIILLIIYRTLGTAYIVNEAAIIKAIDTNIVHNNDVAGWLMCFNILAIVIYC